MSISASSLFLSDLSISWNVTSAAMPTKSLYPPIDIPNVDLWTFLFERKDRPFPDDKSWSPPALPELTRFDPC